MEVVMATTLKTLSTEIDENYNYEKFRSHLYSFENFPGPKVGESALNFEART